MRMLYLRSFAAISGLTASAAAVAANSWSPMTVPVDSPWAIAGLGAVVAVVAARLLINRRH